MKTDYVGWVDKDGVVHVERADGIPGGDPVARFKDMITGILVHCKQLLT